MGTLYEMIRNKDACVELENLVVVIVLENPLFVSPSIGRTGFEKRQRVSKTTAFQKTVWGDVAPRILCSLLSSRAP